MRRIIKIEMNSQAGNHPYKTFLAIQDQFSRRESSLQELFCNSGCISPLEIIPARAFLQIRMNFPAGNHPCESFSAIQDQFLRRKSSLQDNSTESGCSSPPEIIPTRTFLHIRINFPAGNHPYKTFPANQDAFPRWKSSLQELFRKSGSISPTEIIPTRAFLHIRINFPAGNHPYKSFSANQDESPHWESSLPHSWKKNPSAPHCS